MVVIRSWLAHSYFNLTDQDLTTSGLSRWLRSSHGVHLNMVSYVVSQRVTAVSHDLVCLCSQVGSSLGGDTHSAVFFHRYACPALAVKGISAWTLARCPSLPVRKCGTSRCDFYLADVKTAITIQGGSTFIPICLLWNLQTVAKVLKM